MAHLRHVGQLIADLVNVHIPDPSKVDAEEISLSCLQTLESAKYERINQFEIHKRCQGLVEKCQILNKDLLADALHSRFEELSTISAKSSPEVLSLLLSLSNRPIENSRVKDLDLLRPEDPPKPLTWSTIIAEDPLEDQTFLWRDVEFTSDGTDDENDLESANSDDVGSEPDSSTSRSEDVDIGLSDLIYDVDDRAMRIVAEAKHRPILSSNARDPKSNSEDSGGEKTPFTELRLIREVISMLLGLPTTIFPETETGDIAVLPSLKISHLSHESAHHALSAFTKLGVQLRAIRYEVNKKETIPVVQTFQTALAEPLAMVDAFFYESQRRLLDPPYMLSLSLLDLQVETEKATRLVRQLQSLLIDLESVCASLRPFRVLEGLFDRICVNHNVGDAEGYKFMADIFFECLQTYLRPIQTWMEKGDLSQHDQVIFIKENENDVSNGRLWQDRFHLVHGKEGQLHAPSFLHLAAQKIFNTGKSVVFLKCLGYSEEILGTHTDIEPSISFESVCSTTDLDMLCPFPELFDVALDRWISSKHHASASLLLNKLETSCGLQKSLDALEYIYFYRNGALTSGFIRPIFERLDRGKPGWNDGFVVTDLLHEAFNSCKSVDIERLDAQHAGQPYKDRKTSQRSMSAVEDLYIRYNLTWPIANIIKPSAMKTYQRIFVTLTQLQRAKYLLEKQKMPRTTTQDTAKLQTIYSLHVNLLWFTNTMLTHTTGMIICVNTTRMREDISRAGDIDGMISVHEKYVDQLEDQFLLSKHHSSLRQAVTSILDLSIVYAQVLDEVVGTASRLEGKIKGRQSRQSISSESSDEDERRINHRDGSSAASDVRGGQPRDGSVALFGKLVSAQKTYAQLLGFIIASVRSVSKAKGETYWEILAQSLAKSP